jgi:glycosyltransferase involved in cell wall biosynthesis
VKIEMVLPSLPAAGMEMVVARLTRGLASRGHDVGVTCLEENGTLGEEMIADGFRVSVVPTPGLKPNFRTSPLAHWLRRLKPDVVHAHSGAWLKAANAGRLAAVGRIVYTQHGLHTDDPWPYRVYDRISALKTDRIVTVAESLRRRLLQCGIPDRKITVIPNGISTEAFRPGLRTPDFRRSLGIPQDAVVIGNVARLEPVKNHALLLNAAARVRSVPAVHVVLVGEGSLRTQLEALAASLGIADRVHFLGLLRDTTTIYREFDLFALTSLTEGTSISLLEAMASGVCVVATAVGGSPALLRQGEIGVLVPSSDEHALTDSFTRLIHDPAPRTLLAESARNAVVAQHSERIMLERYEQVYGYRNAAPGAASDEGMRQCAG